MPVAKMSENHAAIALADLDGSFRLRLAGRAALLTDIVAASQARDWSIVAL
jgi:hypothetical protein